MSEQIRCFFIGHRDTPESVYSDLLRAVEEHITDCGVSEFIVGHYGRFDSLAARAVMEAKRQYPKVELTMLLPYHPSKQNGKLPTGFDGSWYPPNMEKVPHRAAIIRANRYAVEHAAYLIAYVRHSPSSAWDLMEFARTKITVTVL